MLGFRPLGTNALTVNHAFKRASGSFAFTLADVTFAESGNVIRNGSASLTLDGVSVSASGFLSHVGSASIPLADIQIAVTGNVLRSGPLSVTLDPIGFVAAGTDVHAGPLSIDLDGVLVSFTGNVSQFGDLSVQLADISVQMIGQHGEVDDFILVLDDLKVAIEGSVIPPAPVSVVTKGGTDKHKKHKNFRNQKDETERDIQKAVNKVFGIEEPSEVEPVEETVAEASPPDFSAQIARLALEAEAKALGQTIEQYQAMLDAERDDEEALLLLL
jgi:hypothetical protein